MILEILPRGIGSEPIVLEATMVIVRADDTTPIMAVGQHMQGIRPNDVVAAAGDFGPAGTLRASHALDEDFNSTLHALGVDRIVVCDRLVLPPPPPGAQLIRGQDPIFRKDRRGNLRS